MALSIEELLAQEAGIRLDIGCGESKQPGFVGMDVRDVPGVDVVWDVEEFPWPLPDECVVVAIASHLVEHINPHKGIFMRFMDEVWRVCKPDAQFAIATPYPTSVGWYMDPTHCNALNEASWAYFDPLAKGGAGVLLNLYSIYTPKPWKIEDLTFSPTANMEVLLRKRREDQSYA